MGRDLLKVQINERIDVPDFEYGLDTALQENIRQVADSFLTDPAKTRVWVIDGFAPEKGTGEQVDVRLGRAISGQRDGAQITYGHIASEGDALKTIDVSSYADGTYSIYIRFEYVDGESQARVFWNGTEEFTQAIETRRLANWSIRVESGTPGGEWVKVGEVDVVSSAIDEIRDTRNLFFEGAVNYQVYPTPGSAGTEYQSGWSSDGGGSSGDRDDLRRTAGVYDLQTFTGAMRQCIEDIKGRGLRNWWDRDIGGLNVGFDASPVEDTVAVGDALHYLSLVAGDPTWLWDTGDSFTYDRATNTLSALIGSTETWRLTSSIMRVLATAGAVIDGGISIGHTVTPVDNVASVGDEDFSLDFNSGNPRVWFDSDSDDYFEYSRGADTLTFAIDSVGEFVFHATGLNILDGLAVGYSATPTSDRISLGDANLYLDFGSGTVPRLQYDSTDVWEYARATNILSWEVGGTKRVYIHPDGGINGVTGAVFGFVGTPVDQQIQLGDADHYLSFVSGDPTWAWDGENAKLAFDRDGGPSLTGYGILVINSNTQMHWEDGAFFLGDAGVTSTDVFMEEDSTLYLRSSAVAHGMTGEVPTDIAAMILLAGSGSGGMDLRAYSETQIAWRARGYGTGEDTTAATTSSATCMLTSRIKSGVSTVALGATGNLFALANGDAGSDTKFIVKGNGDVYVDGSHLTYDDEQDALACRDAMYAFAGESEHILKYDKEQLVRIGIMSEGGFVNLQRTNALLLGGVGELYHVLQHLLTKLGLNYDDIRREVRGLA